MTREIQIPPEKTPGGNVWAPPDKAVDGNGNSHDTVQAAVDTDTDVVFVGPGTFNESVDVTDTAENDGLTIYGTGRGTVIDGGTIGHAIDASAQDMVIKDLAVKTKSGAGNPYDGILIGDNNDKQTGEPMVSDITVLESDRNGIKMLDTAGGWVRGCNIEEADADGIQSTSERLAVIDNQIGDSGSSFDNGILLANQESWADRNLIFGATTGVKLTGTDQKVRDNTLVNCTTNVDDSGATDPAVTGNSPSSANLAPADELVEHPNGNISNVVLDDTESAEISVPVPDGETLRVYRWGAYKISDGSTPTDLDVELKDGGDTVQVTENTTDNESTDPNSPVASHSNSSGSQSIFKLAVANDTGSTIADPGVGAFFAYDVRG